MGVERGRKAHGRACVCWRRERMVAVEGSIWGGVLVPCCPTKNRNQLKTGGVSVFRSCCLTHIIMHYVIQSRYYLAAAAGLSLLHADSLPFQIASVLLTAWKNSGVACLFFLQILRSSYKPTNIVG